MGKLLKLTFKLGEESPLWSSDKVSKAKFGNNITDFSLIKLSPKMILQVSSLSSLFKDRTNPIHPDFPSFWSGEMCAFYQKFTIHVFSELESRFRKFYELENKEIAFMNEKIHIDRINQNLRNFLSDPLKFANDMQIEYQDAEELKKSVIVAYDRWKEKEEAWI